MMIGMLIAFTSVALSIAGLYVIQRHVSPNPTFDVPMDDPRDEPELNAIAAREGRAELAQACFDFLPTRATLDLLGWGDTADIFMH